MGPMNGSVPQPVGQVIVTLLDNGDVQVQAQVKTRSMFLMMMEEAKVFVLDQMKAQAGQKVIPPPPGLQIPRF